ncbi:MAG: hypothetical protein ACE5JR_12595 [Gemmatimonadota bacterium]
MTRDVASVDLSLAVTVAGFERLSEPQCLAVAADVDVPPRGMPARMALLEEGELVRSRDLVRIVLTYLCTGPAFSRLMARRTAARRLDGCRRARQIEGPAPHGD